MSLSSRDDTRGPYVTFPWWSAIHILVSLRIVSRIIDAESSQTMYFRLVWLPKQYFNWWGHANLRIMHTNVPMWSVCSNSVFSAVAYRRRLQGRAFINGYLWSGAYIVQYRYHWRKKCWRSRSVMTNLQFVPFILVFLICWHCNIAMCILKLHKTIGEKYHRVIWTPTQIWKKNAMIGPFVTVSAITLE